MSSRTTLVFKASFALVLKQQDGRQILDRSTRKTLHILPRWWPVVKHGCHRLRRCSFQCHAWHIRRRLEQRGSFVMGLLGLNDGLSPILGMHYRVDGPSVKRPYTHKSG